MLVRSRLGGFIVEMKNLSLQEIEKYGSDVQMDISESMTKLLHDTKCIDLGATGNYLAELSTTSNSITRRLEPRGIMKPFVKAKNWLSRFDNIESSIVKLDENIQKEQDKLNTVLNGLYQSKEVLSNKLDDLTKVQNDLTEYVEYLKNNQSEEDDGLKLQAAVHRLKVITTTIAVTKQEIGKTVLVIQENKEITNQLMEASENLIPMFKTMMMNVLATKANAEAVQLKKSLVKTANKLVLDNAKQIEKTAEDLITGRTESLIAPQTLTEANDILQRTINKVIDSAKTETSVNLELIDSLKASTDSIKTLSLLEDSKNERTKG